MSLANDALAILRGNDTGRQLRRRVGAGGQPQVGSGARGSREQSGQGQQDRRGGESSH